MQLFVKSLLIISLLVFLCSKGYCIAISKLNLNVDVKTMTTVAQFMTASLMLSFLFGVTYLIYW